MEILASFVLFCLVSLTASLSFELPYFGPTVIQDNKCYVSESNNETYCQYSSASAPFSEAYQCDDLSCEVISTIYSFPQPSYTSRSLFVNSSESPGYFALYDNVGNYSFVVATCDNNDCSLSTSQEYSVQGWGSNKTSLICSFEKLSDVRLCVSYWNETIDLILVNETFPFHTNITSLSSDGVDPIREITFIQTCPNSPYFTFSYISTINEAFLIQVDSSSGEYNVSQLSASVTAYYTTPQFSCIGSNPIGVTNLVDGTHVSKIQLIECSSSSCYSFTETTLDPMGISDTYNTTYILPFNSKLYFACSTDTFVNFFVCNQSNCASSFSFLSNSSGTALQYMEITGSTSPVLLMDDSPSLLYLSIDVNECPEFGMEISDTIPYTCSDCPSPPSGFLYNAYTNSSQNCTLDSLPICQQGFGPIITNKTFECSECPTSTNSTGYYNQSSFLGCEWIPVAQCGPQFFMNDTDYIPVCQSCPLPNTTYTYNPEPNFNNSCVAVENEFCPPGYFMNVDIFATCFACPDATLETTWNAGSSLNSTCSASPTRNCTSGEYLQLIGPDPQCISCGPTAGLGTYNDFPEHQNTSCNFKVTANCQAGTQLEFPENGSPRCVEIKAVPEANVPYGWIYGSLAGAGALIAFLGYRLRRSSKKFQVVYRDLDFNTAATGSSEIGGLIETGTNTVNVLSLDGGGIRGIMIVQILSALETELLPKRLIDCFHLIGGTSTGGLVALALKSGFSLPTIHQLYLSFRDKVLKTRFGSSGKLFKRILGQSLYPSDSFESILKDLFEERSLMDSMETSDDSPSVSSGSSFPYVLTCATFTSIDPPVEYLLKTYCSDSRYMCAKPEESWKMWEAARATSAAPLFFPEFVKDHNLYADGALYHNNPSRLLLKEARSIWPNLQFGAFISIGTGNVLATAVTNRSGLGWAKTLAGIVTNSERTHKDMSSEFDPSIYYRLNPKLPQMIPMDSTSNQDIETMELLTQAYLSGQGKPIIDSLIARIQNTFSQLQPSLGESSWASTPESIPSSSKPVPLLDSLKSLDTQDQASSLVNIFKTLDPQSQSYILEQITLSR